MPQFCRRLKSCSTTVGSRNWRHCHRNCEPGKALRTALQILSTSSLTLVNCWKQPKVMNPFFSAGNGATGKSHVGALKHKRVSGRYHKDSVKFSFCDSGTP